MRTIGTVLAGLLFSALLCVVWSCSSSGTSGGGIAGSTGSGNNGGNGGVCSSGSTWNLVTLDGTADGGSALDDLEIAVSSSDTVGIGYLQATDEISDAGNVLYDVRYVQYATSSGTASQPQVIDQVQDTYGVTVAFQPSGTPAVGYLGGPPYGGAGATASHYWYQSAAIVAYQQAGGTWNKVTADDGTNDPDGPMMVDGENTCTATSCTPGCCSPYTAVGPSVVGLYSALGFDSSGNTYDYFRDVLFGQSIGTNSDFGSSRIDGEVGMEPNFTPEWAFLGTTWDYDDSPVLGLGSHLHLVMANGQPALLTDESSNNGGAESGGQNVDFLMRMGANDWSNPVRVIGAGDTQTGPSLAWSQDFGFAAVVYDQSPGAQELLYSQSQTGTTWSKQDDVFAGSGGWYPSIAISPTTQEPTIADFFCSDQGGSSNLTQCPSNQRAVEIRTLNGANWCTPDHVDPAGGYQPKIAFLSSGKAVVAYRQLLPSGQVGPLVLAVEQ